MPITLGSHYISKSAARKLLVAFNRSIKGTKDAPRTIPGISGMDAEGLENKLKEFSIVKKKSGDVLKHKQVISKRYSERIPKDTRRKKETKDAPSMTKPGEKDYEGGTGDIKKSAGKDVKSENSQVDFEPSTQPKKKKKPRSAAQKAATAKLVAANKKRRALAKKNKK